MSVHGRLEVILVGTWQHGQGRIQGIEPEKVPMSTDGRARASVPSALPVIDTFPNAGRKPLHPCGEFPNMGRDVIQYPVYPDTLGSCRVWSVWIFYNKDQTSSPGGDILPVQGWRKVFPSQVYWRGIMPPLAKALE